MQFKNNVQIDEDHGNYCEGNFDRSIAAFSANNAVRRTIL